MASTLPKETQDILYKVIEFQKEVFGDTKSEETMFVQAENNPLIPSWASWTLLDRRHDGKEIYSSFSTITGKIELLILDYSAREFDCQLEALKRSESNESITQNNLLLLCDLQRRFPKLGISPKPKHLNLNKYDSVISGANFAWSKFCLYSSPKDGEFQVYAANESWMRSVILIGRQQGNN